MKEISTCEELLEFLDAANDEESADELEGMLTADIDFCDYGQIPQQYELTKLPKVLDLSGYEVMNIYPLLTALLKMQIKSDNGMVTIKNGYSTNVLISNGAVATIDFQSSINRTNYTTLFTSDNRLKFVNVGFSILGCNFLHGNGYQTSVISQLLYQSFYPSICFERCSFYIKTRNTLPMITGCIFKNCSFQFDCEYDTVSSISLINQNSYVSAYYFCVLNGKIKKSKNYEANTAMYRQTLGEMINCYVNVETDIPNIFINVDLTKNFQHYVLLSRNPESTDTTSLTLGHDCVYNADKYTAVVSSEDGNNELVLGGQALATEQMNDAEYLLECGFLAVDDNDQGESE